MGRSGFNATAVHMGFVVDKEEMGQVSLQVLQFSPTYHHSTNAPYSSMNILIIRGLFSRPT